MTTDPIKLNLCESRKPGKLKPRLTIWLASIPLGSPEREFRWENKCALETSLMGNLKPSIHVVGLPRYETGFI